MIDQRFITFLELCNTMNYTKTAKNLHMTQPAVTHHIHYIESLYNIKLFTYTGKNLNITEQGKVLRELLRSLYNDSVKIEEKIKEFPFIGKKINFGATLTIGEYVMPIPLRNYIIKNPDAKIIMQVDNTEMLINMIKEGKIDFAIIEGKFDKNDYDYRLFSVEEFIGVVSPKHRFAKKEIEFSDIFKERFIAREPGSGTRSIFEDYLIEQNRSINSFESYMEIGNLNTIKNLVKDNMGITFLYKAAAKSEIERGELCQLNIKNYSIKREFNFVALKNSMFIHEYTEFFDFCKKIYTDL